MIPADLAARLRTLTEASFFQSEPPVPGLQRVREIQSQLPDLVPGQRFFATLQRTLPDGSFRAIIAGQQMTLSLDSSAKAGDTLELEVTQVQPRTVFARVLNVDAGGAGAASAQPTLSQTGRLISFLLTGQPPPPPARLGGEQALLNAPPTSGAALVPLLRQAVGQSGLFYESHQVQWVLGKLDAAALLREPQGQQSPAAAAQAGSPPGGGGAGAAGAARSPAGQAAGGSAPAGAGGGTPPAATPATQGGPPRADAAMAQIRGDAGPTGVGAGAEAGAAPAPGAADRAAESRVPLTPIPERLLPLVHQQLDALATQHYLWQGQAWPGQAIEWEIEDPEGGEGGGDEAAQTWNTTLRLALPRLGGVEAQLHLTPAGVALRLRADGEAAIAALDGGAAALASALEAANLKLTGLVVEPRDGGR